MLNRSDILSKKELKKICVSVPDWGGDVFVSEMSAQTRDQWEQKLIDSKEKGQGITNGRATLIVVTVVDEKGNPIFTEKDIPEIGKLSAMSLDKIISAAQKLNGLEVSIEDIKKN